MDGGGNIAMDGSSSDGQGQRNGRRNGKQSQWAMGWQWHDGRHNRQWMIAAKAEAAQWEVR
jgi:hypothetical protein